MKRMTRMGMVLCLIILTMVGAGSAVQDQTKFPPRLRVVQFDVPYGPPSEDGPIVGTLSIHTNTWAYILNAHGLQPDTEYYLNCGGVGSLSSATSNENGDLHLKGVWTWSHLDITESPGPTLYVSEHGLAAGTIGWADISAKWYTTLLWTTVSGKLTDDGVPLPGQHITVSYWKDGAWHWWGSDHTDSNGNFVVTKAFARLQGFKARYDGGLANGIDYGPTYCIADNSMV